MPYTISIIIPAINEATTLPTLLSFLNTVPGREQIAEIIVYDGNSTDDTIAIAASFGVIIIKSEKQGRARQMNLGASIATGDVLYFIHADTIPPASFVLDIQKTVNEGFDLGRYCTKFDSSKLILGINAFFSRLDLFICYGGDQTLFVSRELFNSIGGFNAEMLIMEEYDLVTRAKTKARYKIMQKPVLISARKFETNSWIKVQRTNYLIIKMYKKGTPQDVLAEKYKQLLRYW
ncbi:TIGR04283 family arsenosugar biosynthesis glycosyltransferase [soil metagenome]